MNTTEPTQHGQGEGRMSETRARLEGFIPHMIDDAPDVLALDGAEYRRWPPEGAMEVDVVYDSRESKHGQHISEIFSEQGPYTTGRYLLIPLDAE